MSVELIRVDPQSCPSPHSFRNKAARGMWSVVWLFLFRPSPRIFAGWRRLLLRLFGAKMGRGAAVHPSVRIWAPWNLEMGDYSCLAHSVDCYCVARITLGAHATVSQYSFLCCAGHDYKDPNMRLVAEPISIGRAAWVCADVFVGPGVMIGEASVVGARSTVLHNVESWDVVIGNPAVAIKKRDLRVSGT